jgi:uncharacterized protein YciI
MLFVIHCLDRGDALPRRLALYDAHKSYLASAPVRSVVSGPLLASDGETMIGSLFIVEADDIDEVRRFNSADPFHGADIWADVNIHPFLMRVDNRPAKTDALHR